MAINPETKYAGKVAPATPEYPYGSARNITVPGDGTGTPWEAALVNDIFGFQQSLLSQAGIVPSSNPEEVGNSQYLQSLFKIAGLSAADYAALRLVDSANYVEGTVCHVVDDNTEGAFKLDKTSTDVDDGGVTIVDAADNRWVRQFKGRYNVAWYGGDKDAMETLGALGVAWEITDDITVTTAAPVELATDTDLRIAPGVTIDQTQTGNAGMFSVAAGSTNIKISGGGKIAGPYTGSTPAPLGVYPNSNGAVRLLGVFDNIVENVEITGVEITGWGDYGIFAENTHNSEIHNNHIHKVGRDGIRCYGVNATNVYQNEIHNVSPGLGGTPPNLNAYGVTYTRNPLNEGSPLVNHPPSRNSLCYANNVYDCPTWKALDTHGGVGISFLGNRIADAYIGVGVDEGDTSGLENAPPIDITVNDNQISQGSGNPNGSGVNITSSSNANLGQSIQVCNNVINNFGSGSSTFGQITIGNVDGGIIKDNMCVNANGSAVLVAASSLTRGIEIGGNTVKEMTNAIAAYTVQSGDAQINITSGSFIRTSGTFIAFSFATPNAAYGVSVGEDFQYFGTITKFTASSKARIVGGNLLRSSKANGRVTSAGALSGNFGIDSVNKTGTGVYDVTLIEAMEGTNTMYPEATARSTTPVIAVALPTSTTVVQVRTFDDTGAPVDAEFSLNVLGI